MALDNVANESNAAAIAEVVERLSEIETLDESEIKAGPCAAIIPDGKTLRSLKDLHDEWRTKPERRKGTATLTTIESFVDHAKRFKDDDSAIFADVYDTTKPGLISVINYHGAGAESLGHQRFGDHRGVYAFPVSEEWTTWKGKVAPMEQEAFAAFIEDRIVDIVDPDTLAHDSTPRKLAADLGLAFASPARMMELSRGLSVAVGQEVKNHINASTGEAQIAFTEKHGDVGGQPLRVPGIFAISIPAFRAGAIYIIPVRLRYRVASGKIVWWFQPHGMDRVWDHAVKEAAVKASTDSGLPLFYGKPEDAWR